MEQIRVIIDQDHARVFTPYNKDFVTAIKRIGGARWSGGCWVIPTKALGTVRKMMVKCYGESDVTPAEKVDVEVTFTEEMSEHCGGVQLFGKSVCHAWGRDTGAMVDDGVELLEGSVDSGGSARNWKTVIEEGTKVIMRDVCKALVKADECYGYEVRILNEKVDRGELEAERERLQKRIEEIDAILESEASALD